LGFWAIIWLEGSVSDICEKYEYVSAGYLTFTSRGSTVDSCLMLEHVARFGTVSPHTRVPESASGKLQI